MASLSNKWWQWCGTIALLQLQWHAFMHLWTQIKHSALFKNNCVEK